MEDQIFAKMKDLKKMKKKKNIQIIIDHLLKRNIIIINIKIIWNKN